MRRPRRAAARALVRLPDAALGHHRPAGFHQYAAFVVATELSPRALLERAQRVEAMFGRDRAREQRWGPRTLDIDIIAYDELALDEPGLTLPHPAFNERAFVLAPLAEIVPSREIAGVRIADAFARLDLTGIEKLPPR